MIELGHSLGGRLHLLSNIATKERRRGWEEINGSVLGNVLISFNNWKAEDSLPLLNSVKSVMKVFNASDGVKDGRQRRRGRLSFFDEEERYDEQVTTRERRRAPSSSSSSLLFEFNPPPDVFWNMIDGSYDGGDRETRRWGRYTVSNNLIVQFDQDHLDQSSELAHKLTSLSTTVTSNVKKRNLKFAVLKGTYLTPFFVYDDIDDKEEDEEMGGYRERARRRRKRQEEEKTETVTIGYRDDTEGTKERGKMGELKDLLRSMAK